MIIQQQFHAQSVEVCRLLDELLHFADQVLRVGVLSDAGKMRADLVDECLSLAWVCTVKAALDHIVAKLIFHHVHKGTGGRGMIISNIRHLLPSALLRGN